MSEIDECVEAFAGLAASALLYMRDATNEELTADERLYAAGRLELALNDAKANLGDALKARIVLVSEIISEIERTKRQRTLGEFDSTERTESDEGRCSEECRCSDGDEDEGDEDDTEPDLLDRQPDDE
jgi:hypothetical protein